MSSNMVRSHYVSPSPGRAIAGVALVIFGVLLLLQQAGVEGAGRIVGAWWPAVIVAFGATRLVSGRERPIGSIIVILVGLALLAGSLEIVPGGAWPLIWPLILIAVGISVVMGRSSHSGEATSDENHLDLVVLFGGLTQISRATALASANLTALFGGVTADLRNAQLDPSGASMDATAIFGGVEIRVPHGWRVDVTGFPLFGGYDNKALEEELPAGAPALHVRVTAIFGGVEIKH